MRPLPESALGVSRAPLAVAWGSGCSSEQPSHFRQVWFLQSISTPAPPLFPPAQVADTATDVAAQKKQASALINDWVATHGTKKDDKAFVTWIEQVCPTPPADLTAQMPTVVALDKKRTVPGIAAATWLESYGKKDIWKLYVHDQRERSLHHRPVMTERLRRRRY
jgi:hypothetical protein